MVSRTVLTRSGPISLNAARPVITVQPRTTVNNAGPMKNVIINAYSTTRRPFNKITTANNSNFNKRANTVNDKNVNTARPNAVVNTARPKYIENLIDLKVKVIRCDNGTEFKNRVMNQFCEIKGIKREFSVARTPQQNGVAKRINRTLIEAARTMLADSKLPTTFWAEAVNTACSVQNKVLVIKPQNKTPYELFLGRKPALSFMRPFGSPIKILNTIDHLGSGPNWLFDIDALTKSINYKPIVVGNQSNGNAGTKACNDAGKARMEIVPGKDYILLPMWPADPLFSQDSKSSPDARFKPSEEEEKKDAKDPGNKDSKVPSTEEPRVNQEKDGPEHTDDEIVAEDQPGAEDASPAAQSPDYVLESDPEANPEEDDNEDPEEDPVDYPADGGDDGDGKEGSSKDDEDDDADMEADRDEEEEEHLAPADSVVVALPATNQAPFTDETEPFKTDESAATPPLHPAYRVTARISIPAPVPTPLWSDAEVARLLAISTPPSSPLSPWSSPHPQIPSPSLPLSPPSLVLSPAPPPSPIRSLGYRPAMIRMRAEAASTSHSLPLPPPFILSPTRPDAPSLGIPPPLPILVPTSSPPLLLPSASRREDRPEVTLPPQKRLGIALGSRYEVGESSSAAAARSARGLRADYVFLATIDSGDQTDMRVHALLTRLMETEARMSREAWGRSMDASDLVRADVMSLRTTVLAQMLEIRELHDADRRRQAVISEMLRADQRRSTEMRELRTADHTRQQQLIQTLTVMQSLQREVTPLLRQGPVGGSAQLELPEEAGSSS
ncbi:putative reverse transcriptase domain-containing protein [Tanacetum coccineum]